MRYEIDWIPTASIMSAAKERGMPEGDDSPLDYCEPEDCSICKVTPNFERAIEIAREKLAEDFFGCVRIERMVLVRDRITGDRWEADAVWHVSDCHSETLDADEPHERPDLMLYDGEEIVGR
jgi:hypothetical protein